MATTPKPPARGNLTRAQKTEQARIISEGDCYGAYRFARNTPGAATKTLQEMVLARGEGYDAYCFATVPGADILACARRVISLGPQDEEENLERLSKEHPEVLTLEVLAELSLGITL